jgi:hypothetical protein
VVQCHGLSKEWYGGKGCDHHGLWLVLLESTKDHFLGVDPPRTTHAATCLVWNNLLTNLDCFRECALLSGAKKGTWGTRNLHGERGTSVGKP